MSIHDILEEVSFFDTSSTVNAMAEIDWTKLDFDQRAEALEYFTDRLYREFGPDAEIKELGYDIDDAQWIVWCAYERALETGRIRLGLL